MRFIRYIVLPVILFLAFASCHGPGGVQEPGGARDPASGAHDSTAQSLPIPGSLEKKAMNTYVGHLGDGLVTMVINYISGDAVSGYTVQRGRRRNFNGGVQLQGAALRLQLEEAGDQPGKFEFVLDTLGWRMTGRGPVGGEWRQLNAAALPDGWPNGNYDTWFPVHRLDSRDSVLILRNDGLCEFRFYLRPWDSTSQMITIRGNYERQSGREEGYKVEWEENEYLRPASEMLKLKHDVLTGNGLRLVRLVVP